MDDKCPATSVLGKGSIQVVLAGSRFTANLSFFRAEKGVIFGWTEIGITLGFVGLFGWMVLRFLSRHPVAPHRDPLFEESVRFHG